MKKQTKDTKKFGLLIVDDDPQWRAIYKEWLNDPEKGHYLLKDIWDSESIKECEDAKSAIEYIKKYKEENDYHLIVIADAFMPPNCDGSSVLEPNEPFGGFYLIDEVNKDNELKDFVTILLVTYYDTNELIKSYRNGKISWFKWEDGKHYFFVKKPLTESDVVTVDEATKLLSEANKKLRDKLFTETIDIIRKIIKCKEEKEELKSKDKYRPENIIGQSERMQEVFVYVHSVAPSKANVLLRGESGTGKELIAKAIHYMSPRAKEPFVKFNCASIPEGLLESELFGYEKGAFTGAMAMRKGRFELADGGTIFLDEIGDLPLGLQPKILRVLQEKEFERVGGEKTIKVDVRLIAATSRNLEDFISEGKFRGDLYYRLNVVPIFLPPLREKIEDVPLLVDYFLEKYNEENDKSVSITYDTLNILTNHDWPGNVRELENVIERLVVMTQGTIVEKENMPSDLLKPATTSNTSDYIPKNMAELAEMEKQMIIAALKQNSGNKAAAASSIGMDDGTLANRLKRYGINTKNLKNK